VYLDNFLIVYLEHVDKVLTLVCSSNPANVDLLEYLGYK